MTPMKIVSSLDRNPIGVIGVVVFFLVASAVVRLASGTAQAIALELDGLVGQKVNYPELDFVDGAQEIDKLLQDLTMKSEELAFKEREFTDRENALNELRSEAEERLNQLEAARKGLEDMISIARSAAEQDIAQLVKVYESMKPKEAARVFQHMPPEFAAGFLSRMLPETAANIVSNLDPTAAYSISVVLAGRNLSPKLPSQVMK